MKARPGRHTGSKGPPCHCSREWSCPRGAEERDLRSRARTALRSAPPTSGSCVKQVEGVGTRLTLLWFLQQDPREVWERHFADLGAVVAASGLGDVVLVAPFVPTVPGTDRYVDELR